MYKFIEIIGAELEDVTESDASYEEDENGAEHFIVKGLSLAFDRGWFVIENPHNITGATSLNEIIGSKVVDAFSNDDEISLKFNNGEVISVSLKAEDFVGQEAASYSPKDGEMIIFS